MSKVLRTVGRVAGALASVASIIPGGQVIGAIAGAVSVVAGIAAGSGGRPPAQGNISQIIIDANSPTPIGFGQSFFGGVLIYEEGYGQDGDIPNPYLAQAYIYSGGNNDAIVSSTVDYQVVGFSGNAATGYYNDFLYRDIQIGAKPESSALSLNYSGAQRWGASHRLSGYAAALFNARFDPDGERFAAKRPDFGAVGRWNKCYDIRKDSTYPGGNGSHRLDDPSTHEWTENPALCTMQYALGFYTDGKLDFGVGLPIDNLIVEQFIAWANVCELNDWGCNGHVFEPDRRYSNVRELMLAGGARPLDIGGRLGVFYNAPRIAIDTVDIDDLAQGNISVQDGTAWASRLNTLIPRYRMPSGQWPFVDGQAVEIQAHIDQDGEVKEDRINLNKVTNANQAAQLAAYELVNARELGPITLTLKHRFRHYSIGDVLTLNLGALDDRLDNLDCVIEQASFDYSEMTATVTLSSETHSKHDFALGRTDTPPNLPVPVTGAEFDVVASSNRMVNLEGDRVTGTLPVGKAVPELVNENLRDDIDAAGETANWDGLQGNVPDTVNNDNITIDDDGVISGIGTVNAKVLNDLLAAPQPWVTNNDEKFEILGNTITKINDSFSNNFTALSAHANPSFFVSCDYDFSETTQNVFIGLTNKGVDNVTASEADFAAHIVLNLGGGSNISFRNNSINLRRDYRVSTNQIASSGTLQIVCEGGTIYLYVSGILLDSTENPYPDQDLRAAIRPTRDLDFSTVRNCTYGVANNSSWSRVSGEGRPADNATSNTFLTSTHANVLLEANRWTLSVAGVDKGIRTNKFRGGCFFEFTLNSPHIHYVILSTTQTNSRDDLGDFSIRINNYSSVFAIVGGVGTSFNAVPSFDEGDRIGIGYDSSKWFITLNGLIVYTTPAIAGLELEASMYTGHPAAPDIWLFEGITWLPYNDASFEALGGLGMNRSGIVTSEGVALAVTGQDWGATAPRNELENSNLLPAIGDAASTAIWESVSGQNKPEDNADVTDTSLPTQQAPVNRIVIIQDTNGVIDSSQYNRTYQFKRTRGTQDVSSSSTWSTVSTGCTSSVDANGVARLLSITSINPMFTVKSVRGGIELLSHVDVDIITEDGGGSNPPVFPPGVNEIPE